MLLTRFEVARQLYNALLGEALKRLRLLKQSKAYQVARHMPIDAQDKETREQQQRQRAAAFAQARIAVGFTEDALSRYATTIHQSWIGDRVDAVIGQTLTKRAFQAANRVALGHAKKPALKGNGVSTAQPTIDASEPTRRAITISLMPTIIPN